VVEVYSLLSMAESSVSTCLQRKAARSGGACHSSRPPFGGPIRLRYRRASRPVLRPSRGTATHTVTVSQPARPCRRTGPPMTTVRRNGQRTYTGGSGRPTDSTVNGLSRTRRRSRPSASESETPQSEKSQTAARLPRTTIRAGRGSLSDQLVW
jgi:hypothetical protein